MPPGVAPMPEGWPPLNVVEAALEVKDKRIAELENSNEAMREAGDALWSCVRHAPSVDPAELMEAIADWQEMRRHG